MKEFARGQCGLVVTKPRLTDTLWFVQARIARLDRCTGVCFAQQVAGRAGMKGALTIRNEWAYVQRRFHVVHHEKRKLVRSHTSHTRCCCAYCGSLRDHETGTCVDVTQQSVTEALIVAYSQRRVHGGSRSHILEEPASLWKARSVHDRPNRQAVNRDDDKANTV